MADIMDMKFHVSGMHCGSCVGRAEAALKGVDGVSAAHVNLASKSAHVTVERPGIAADLETALEKAGYAAEAAQHRFTVKGMNCASCVGRLENALQAVPGVVQAHVNLARGDAVVMVLGDGADAARIAAAGTASGYPMEPVDEAAPEDRRRRAAAEEIASLRRQTIIAAVLTLPVFMMEMGSHMIPAIHHLIMSTIGQQTSWLIQFVLVSAVLAGPGRLFFARGVPALLRGAPDMNALVVLGTSAAWGFSTVALFAPGILPAGTAAVYFEAAAVIVTLMLLGRYLEARAKAHTGEAIERLIGLRPSTARVRKGGKWVEVPAGQVRVGDLLQIRPGERMATDGTVAEGASYVDESMIMGEPAPVQKGPGDAVVGGTVNGSGSLNITATQVGADTVLAQIIRLVESAQGARLPVQDLVNRITLWFVPAVMAAAAVTFSAWLAFGPEPALSFSLVAGVAVLIVACPCAMGLATPTSIMVGAGRAAELGVLFRQGDALQRLQDVRAVAFDKTGTLTRGQPELTDLTVADGFEEARVLALLAGAEAASEHPVARAVLRRAEQAGITVPEARETEALAGLGLRAQVDGETVLAGTARLMEREGVDISAFRRVANDLADAAKSPLFVAIGGQVAALAAVADPIKPGAREAVRALRKAGVSVAMVTGDAEATARAIAAELGIEAVRAEVLPGDKAGAVGELEAAFGPTAFVGDGINDAPALARASVGLAMGTGTDIAMDAADVVLMSGDPRGVLQAIDTSCRTMRNIRENLFWAFGYNALLIPVAAGVLYPAFGLLLSPSLAAGAMALSSVFVVTNALRLRRIPGLPAGNETRAARARPSEIVAGDA